MRAQQPSEDAGFVIMVEHEPPAAGGRAARPTYGATPALLSQDALVVVDRQAESPQRSEEVAMRRGGHLRRDSSDRDEDRLPVSRLELLWVARVGGTTDLALTALAVALQGARITGRRCSLVKLLKREITLTTRTRLRLR